MRTLIIGNYPPDAQFSMRRYARQLAEGLRRESLVVDLWLPTVFFGSFLPTQSGLGKWLGYIDKYIISFFVLQGKLLASPRYDIVHLCDHSNSHYALGLRPAKLLITCHDMIAVRAARGEFPFQKISWTGRLQQRLILHGMTRANSVACVSHATAIDLKRLLGQKCPETEIIENGIEPTFLEAGEDYYGSNHPNRPTDEYILHIGNSSWYKNRSAVISIYVELLKDYPKLLLYVVGPPFNADELNGTDGDFLQAKVKYITNVSDSDLKQLYTHAQLLVFPSRIEGFGWPILEAQACGCPVACLDRGPMRELNARPDLLMDTQSEASAWPGIAADKCRPYLRMDVAERREIAHELRAFASGFTLPSMIAKLKALYSDLLEK